MPQCGNAVFFHLLWADVCAARSRIYTLFVIRKWIPAAEPEGGVDAAVRTARVSVLDSLRRKYIHRYPGKLFLGAVLLNVLGDFAREICANCFQSSRKRMNGIASSTCVRSCNVVIDASHVTGSTLFACVWHDDALSNLRMHINIYPQCPFHCLCLYTHWCHWQKLPTVVGCHPRALGPLHWGMSFATYVIDSLARDETVLKLHCHVTRLDNTVMPPTFLYAIFIGRQRRENWC